MIGANSMIKDVDLDGVTKPNGNLWGLPHTPKEAALVIIPVPWEVTVSFRGGTKDGPDAILAASPQIDLYDPGYRIRPQPWEHGVALSPLRWPAAKKNAQLRPLAQSCIAELEDKRSATNPFWLAKCARINSTSEELVKNLYLESLGWLEQDKIVAVLGGDHSTPLGLMKAVADRHKNLGVLHLDAHFDLRNAYEGFKYSHASIMRNASESRYAQKFIHVGVRDYCRDEHQYVKNSNGRHCVYTERNLRRRLFDGNSWRSIVHNIVFDLPQDVYVSFDIDGLDPSLCPHTGTPVPGGLQFEEAMFLIDYVVKSGRRIVGFDLVEVAPASNDRLSWEGDWNANVGMRVLYRLSCLAIESNRKK